MTFPTKAAMKRHRDDPVHQTMFECGPCDRAFNSNQQFAKHKYSKSHMRSVEKLTCHLCGVVFEYGHQFDKHTETEDHARNVKEASCCLCKVSCESFEEFEQHIDSAEHALRVKDLTCRHCDEYFWTQDEWTEHTNSDLCLLRCARDFKAEYEVCLEYDLAAAARYISTILITSSGSGLSDVHSRTA
jgi:uncharacterized C2H2 Zn-finger protein